MSHMLETVDGRANLLGVTESLVLEPRQPVPTELIELCDRAAIEMSMESMGFFSAHSHRIIRVNRAACEYLGYTQHQLQRMSVHEIAPQATNAQLAKLCNRVARSANQRGRVRTVYRHRSGALMPVNCAIRTAPELPRGVFVAIGRHSTPLDRKSGSWQVREAFRDSVTLLPNRAWLWQQLELAFEAMRRSDQPIALLFIDIDRFKQVNDTHGHLVGDAVLRAVAERLSVSVRPEDVVARYGGDEFVVLLKDVPGRLGICRVAERIGRSLEATGKSRGEFAWRAQVTVSIGVAISGGEDSSSVDLLERADRAMYRAKALGRVGRYVVDDPAGSLQSTCFRG
jgi:diguanylate cyclase (GGDEF)-like protein/PAS domain S-box-containing protein